ncbi:NADPH-dependent 7-cyano-7-deazaguanine reductase QueF [Aliidiomarina shirensis]|uniref:NADPH-dependent 7-cyano-7-deazaguanine reductase n=1 Tax=Aliidiomarina shirensis TaxID=1048642 RepID=A0A432WWQ8_9GAMM|nr:NADPH-dependent 7-cyano-7-deazaguanine reductase QueF [Aliidiomarina shirensis]RUO38191.1 NADPH-dependent 7-cyano-7-deazaguanine reductase QueF [Aliidiomarina shirensis]
MPVSPKDPMADLKLGEATEYPAHYDADLLQPVPRQLNRSSIGVVDDALPFAGRDLWTCYELSWLQPNGVPKVAIAEVEVPATSANLIESKSFKLYLNGYNQSTFASEEVVLQQLTRDLSSCAGAPVEVRIYSLDAYTQHGLTNFAADCIDNENVNITTYDYEPELLNGLITSATSGAGSAAYEIVSEKLCSHLLKSNCLITNQPDWGSVYIEYTGPKINRAALLGYLISFRNHNEFHEQCVERIHTDLMQHARCESLTVFARYTRRGGLDINPVRHTRNNTIDSRLFRGRLARQ